MILTFSSVINQSEIVIIRQNRYVLSGNSPKNIGKEGSFCLFKAILTLLS